MSRELAPSDITFLMHVYAIAEPCLHPAHNWLEEDGFIERSETVTCGWRLTEGGEMLVAAILKTPLPILRWTMP